MEHPFSERSAEIVQKQYDIAEVCLKADKRGVLAKRSSSTDYTAIDIFGGGHQDALWRPGGAIALQDRIILPGKWFVSGGEGGL